MRGISDSGVRTLKRNLQTTMRDILPVAMCEALKAKSATRGARQVQRFQGELVVPMSKGKTAEIQTY